MQARLLHGNTRSRDLTPVAACSAGDVIQFPDGRAGVCIDDIAAGVLGAAYEDGVFECTKNTDGALLAGGDAFWDVSAGHAQYKPDNGTADFFIGVVVEYDEPTTDTTVNVDLNKQADYVIDLENRSAGKGMDGWTYENTDGLGVTADLLAQRFTLSFDAVAEVAQAALYSKRTVPINARPIFEGRMAIYNIGDNAALDINFGLASATHATDFEAVAAFATVQLDGNSLNINTHSDDGTTDRAPVDSSIDAVDDAFFEVWIDARDDTNVKFYIDGVLVDTLAAKRILTAALATAVFPIAHIEKTSDDTVADVRVTRMRVRTQAE